MAVVRILHFSDIHLVPPDFRIEASQLLNKRLLGLINLKLRRASRFRDAPHKLEALHRWTTQSDIHCVVCTGDYTALGTESELAFARDRIQAFTKQPLGFVTVPGNHDVYLPDCAKERRFEKHFGEFLQSDLPDLCTDGAWPIVKLLNSNIAIVAVNSARPNPQLWRSSGRIPDAQIEGLVRVLRDERIRDRFIVVATHYAPLRENGQPDHIRHGLTNTPEFLKTCSSMRHGMIVHGHIHRQYQVRTPQLQVPIFGAGSATDAGREGAWIFEIREKSCRATPLFWKNDHFEENRESALHC